MDRHVRIGQINLGRSRIATLEVRQLMVDYNLDVVLMQEPYSTFGFIRGLGSNVQVLYKDKSPMAAVAASAVSSNIIFISHLSSKHISCIEFSGCDPPIHFVSHYFQFAESVDGHLAALAEVLRSLQGCRVVVGADINAKSSLWGPGPSNIRGRAAEEFIETHNLLVWNDPSSPPTFCSSVGESHIDITLSTNSLAGKIFNWTVHEGVSTSDHNLITFEIDALSEHSSVPISSSLPPPLTLPAHFRTNTVSWKPFLSKIAVEMDKLAGLGSLTNPVQVNNYASLFTSSLILCCERTLGRIPAKSKKTPENPWWNPSLERFRRSLRAARRAVRQARCSGADPAILCVLLQKFRSLAFHYKKKILSAKTASWHKFISLQAENDHWGPAYRAISLATRGSKVLSGLQLSSGSGFANTVKENAKAFLDALISSDNCAADSPSHFLIRRLASLPMNTPHTFPPTLEEVNLVVRRLGPGKAPGLDRLSSVIIRKAWIVAKPEIFKIIHACFHVGVFPDCWKTGLLTVIPKAKCSLPLTNPKAYRPITLLPVLGKVLERLLAAQIISHLNKNCPISPRQFGFRSGKSTEDAISAVLDTARVSSHKYVLAIFLDIQGAFDCAWWPLILVKLRLRGIPGNLYNMVQDYFKNRQVVIEAGSSALCRPTSIGCPQGSVLGPLLWNILCDDLLSINVPPYCTLFAYADDTTLVVEANSRAVLEQQAEIALKAISEWGEANRLIFAPHKTEALLLKGRLSPSRPPRISFCGKIVRSAVSVVYLGVRLDDHSHFLLHARGAVDKAKAAFHHISRIAGNLWGVGFRTRLFAYNSIFCGIVGYAASCWASRCSLTQISRILISGQRPPLINLCRAYKTISSAALHIIAGVLPLDLEIQLRAASFCFKRDLPLRIGSISVHPTAGEGYAKFKHSAYEAALDQWQQRWDRDTKGRHTYLFFPDVRTRLRAVWFEPDFYTTQLISGHGNFKARLAQFGFATDSACTCGPVVQDVNHILWSCPHLETERSEMFSSVRQVSLGPAWSVSDPIEHSDLVSKVSNFRALSRFAAAFGARESPLSPLPLS